MKVGKIEFPEFSGTRCLMMPYIQGDSTSVPDEYHSYDEIIDSMFIRKGDVGYLTIDESVCRKGQAHRAYRAKTNRALHTEVGRQPDKIYTWGSGGGWGSSHTVTLDRNVEILLANNIDDSCAVWDSIYENTSIDGDIGFAADKYPLDTAVMMKAGEVHSIGILTPHESLAVTETTQRQFLRIIGAGVTGREPYFTINPNIK